MDFIELNGESHSGEKTGADVIHMPIVARKTAQNPGIQSMNAWHDNAPEAQAVSRPLGQVSAYWHALRAGRIVPDRSDVDPRGIEDVLRYCFIVERIARGHARIRIAGTHLGDIMGMEVRGMPLSALFEPAARGHLQTTLSTLFDGPNIQHLTLRANARIGKPRLDATLSLFPLRDDKGEITRALGCLHAAGPIGRAPRRFNITGGSNERLAPLETKSLTASRAQESTETQDRLRGFSDPQANFKETTVPYLRVLSRTDT